MCRSIKPLFNFDPPATEQDLKEAARQFVRKISGFREPSKANQAAFDHAIDVIAGASGELIASLVTTAHPKQRMHAHPHPQ